MAAAVGLVVALVARDVIRYAIDQQTERTRAVARSLEAEEVHARLDATAKRLEAAEAQLRDLAVSRIGRR